MTKGEVLRNASSLAAYSWASSTEREVGLAVVESFSYLMHVQLLRRLSVCLPGAALFIPRTELLFVEAGPFLA
jgi:hypothetical protein